MNETIFRILAALVLFTGTGISIYFRRKADRDSGEKLSRSLDGVSMMMVIRVFGSLLWLSPLAYLLNPQWMAWSKFGLPEWMRWFGVMLGVVCVGLIYWLFTSIQSGISPVSATRKNHRLVTHGIYRWVRHPLYTIGSSLIISFGLISDNWFICLLAVLAFIAMAIRTPKEEANLIEKFGDEYRDYMKRTGRFLPKMIRQ
jgi:protein-S-isoprenylcysteine O-methyltransferase Ste14